MWQPALFSLVATSLVSTLAVQVPLSSSQHPQDHLAVFRDGDVSAEWNLNALPNPNATDHLVFETVHSLLQHWPNTRMRNGHTIAPAIVPNGTLLYRGWVDDVVPTGPDWVAMDPEHSYLFAQNLFDRSQLGGWHLTLMATRPLKVVYFDGNSAAKLPYGMLDTQDFLAWGRRSDQDRIYEEEVQRLYDLCAWGKTVGVDGFVRMEMAFEIMLCDFRSGVEVVSLERVASEYPGPEIAAADVYFEIFSAGAWHNHFPGETRMQLDFARLISFYDTQLVPSLVPIRVGQERWDHRVANVSREDFAAAKSQLEANLMRPDGASSGIDWQTLLQVIVDRYAQRFELTRYLVNTATKPDNTLDFAKKVQTQLRLMLQTYIPFSVKPTDPSDDTNLDWTIPVYKLCSTMHTQSMESRFESMTDSEKLILQAIRGTSREICRVVTKMWAAGVYAGIDSKLNKQDSPDIIKVAHVRDIWAEDLQRLMSWLDWSVWVKCDHECDTEEICYMPTWPIGFPVLGDMPVDIPLPIDEFMPQNGTNGLALRSTVLRKFTDEVHDAIKPEPDEWIRPQPKCVRRVSPYRY